MTKAALNILDDNPNGLFLHVEGGAVDWANHDKQGGRMIEEQIDFNNAVQAVVDWIETNSSWEESLLILTADHECGLLWGPDSYNIAYDPIVDNGQGNMPGLMYNSGSHSNSLVPVYAKGVNSELFDTFADEYDPIRGYYIDNTEIFEVMNAAIPEPGISSFFVLFTFTLLRRKR